MTRPGDPAGPAPSEHRRWWQAFSALSAGEAGARVIGFGATVLMARFLGAAGYGVIGVATAVRLYFLCMVEAGIDSIGVREIAANPDEAAELAGGLLWSRLMMSIGLMVALGLVALALGPELESAVIAAYALTLLPVALTTRWLHIGLGNSRVVALARLAGETTLAVLVLGLVREPGDLPIIPLAQLVDDAVVAAVLAVAAKRRGLRILVKRGRERLAPVLKLARPLAGHALLGLVIFNADLLLLRLFRPIETVGHYAAAYALISFLLNLGVAYYQSLLPGLSRGEAGGRAVGLYRLAVRYALLAGVLVVAGGVALAGPVLPLIFGARFAPAVAPLRLLLFSVPVALIRNVGQAGLVAAGQTREVFHASLIAMVVAMALNLLLIPPYGMAGAAVATVATEVVRTAVVLHYARGEGYPTLRSAIRPLGA